MDATLPHTPYEPTRPPSHSPNVPPSLLPWCLEGMTSYNVAARARALARRVWGRPPVCSGGTSDECPRPDAHGRLIRSPAGRSTRPRPRPGQRQRAQLMACSAPGLRLASTAIGIGDAPSQAKAKVVSRSRGRNDW